MIPSDLFQIEKLNENNYNTWKLQIKSLLIINDLWSVSLADPPEDPDENIVWKNKDDKCLAFIILTIDPSLLLYVKDAATSKEAFQKLKDVFEPTGPVRKVYLFKRLLQLKMSTTDSLSNHINEFSQIADSLSSIDIKLDDELLSIILLSSLPSSYESFIVAIESRDELPSLQVLIIKLLDEEQRRITKEVKSQHSSQQLQQNHVSNEMDVEVKSVSESELDFGRKLKQLKKKMKMERKCCFISHNSVDLSNKCKKKKKHHRGMKRCHSPDHPKYAGLVQVVVSDLGSEKEWYLDSGATNHMCFSKDAFTVYKKIEPIYIQLTNNQNLKAIGKGTVKLNFGKHDLVLTNVLHVPGANRNLISISELSTFNKITFEDKCAHITSFDGTIGTKALKRNGLYVLHPINDILWRCPPF